MVEPHINGWVEYMLNTFWILGVSALVNWIWRHARVTFRWEDRK